MSQNDHRLSQTRGPEGGPYVVWGVGTSRTMRVHWMLHELNCPYTTQKITSRSGQTQTSAYVALNPSQKIPALQCADWVLTESAAIVNFLATCHGSDCELSPPTQPHLRAIYDEWCFFSMMELDANTLYVIRKHLDLSALYGEASAAVNAAQQGFKKQANAAAVRLSKTGPYVMGNTFSAADILFSTCLSGALRRQIPLPQSLLDYLTLTTKREAYRSALVANQVV